MKETAIVIAATICLTICFVTAAITMPNQTALFMTIAVALGGVLVRYVPKLVGKIKKQ